VSSTGFVPWQLETRRLLASLDESRARLQVSKDAFDLLQGTPEVFSDLSRQHVRPGSLEESSSDSSLSQKMSRLHLSRATIFLVGEHAPTAFRVPLLLPCRLALVAIFRVVALDKFVEVRTDHAPLLQRKFLVSAAVRRSKPFWSTAPSRPAYGQTRSRSP